MELRTSIEIKVRGDLAERLYQAIKRTGFIDSDKLFRNKDGLVIPGKELGIGNLEDFWKGALTFQTQA